MNATEPLIFVEDFEELFVDVQTQHVFEDQNFLRIVCRSFRQKKF